MSEKTARIIPPEVAEQLIPDGPFIHCFRNINDEVFETKWSRQRVIERFTTHGVELSGDNMRRANHGICSFDQELGWLYIETRLEAKKP